MVAWGRHKNIIQDKGFVGGSFFASLEAYPNLLSGGEGLVVQTQKVDLFQENFLWRPISSFFFPQRSLTRESHASSFSFPHQKKRDKQPNKKL